MHSNSKYTNIFGRKFFQKHPPEMFRPATLLKSDSNTGVFLKTFKNAFIYRTSSVAASDFPRFVAFF